jgi:hypothetical protein
MARIRTIKPEFWEDYRMARELTRDQRLFYIGLWNESDDEGRFLAHPRRLLGVIFPYEDDFTEEWVSDSLRVLVDTGRVVLYEAGGEPYGQLTKFADHQRINRPSPSKIPSPDCASSIITETSVKTHGGHTEDSPPEQGTGNREQGREQGNPPNPPTEDFSESDGSDWIHPTDRLSGSQVLHAWIEHQPGPVPAPERKRQRRFARKLAGSHTAEEVAAAFVGMTQLFPHCPPKSEPWDLEDLDRKFAKALAKARDHPEIRDADFDREFTELTQQMEANR